MGLVSKTIKVWLLLDILKRLKKGLNSRMKIDLTRKGSLIVPLEESRGKFYASLNFHYNPDTHGPEPDLEIVHVYLLHPLRGSILFTLRYDRNFNIYYPTEEVIGVDTIILDKINTAIQSYIKGL